MASETEKDGRTLFQCDECKFLYKTKELAKQCENWCKEHHSCNLDITKHSVESV